MTWTNLFLYLALLSGVVIIILIILIGIENTKYIKLANKRRRDKAVEYIRQTSKHNKEPRKRLKF